MMQKVNIRTAEKKDISDIFKLENLIFKDPWSINSITETIDSPNETAICACSEDSNLIGYALLSFVLDEVNINRIAVDPLYRSRGIGSCLIRSIQEMLPVQVNIYNLEVRQSNKTAITVYLSQGFEQVGIRKNFYSDPCENAILMTKRKV